MLIIYINLYVIVRKPLKNIAVGELYQYSVKVYCRQTTSSSKVGIVEYHKKNQNRHIL